jgi:UDP-GlcNAc:undecaprenyl-phosphate GlcNAc-1-phosphate transferase
MTQYLAIVAATGVLSAALTWAVRQTGWRRGWMAQPRADRSHTTPTALFGGAAIFLALALGLAGAGGFQWPLPALLGLTAGMFLLGLADDVWELRPQSKLVAQIAAGLTLYLCNFHFNAEWPWLLDLAIVVVWVVGITNAMNLLDNMNGLCAGTAAIAATFRLVLFLQDGNEQGAMQSAVFLGALLGFLVFNFPRATIFMGDAGSLVVGFFLAALNLTSGESYSKSLFAVLFFPVLALAIPIFDTAFVSVARWVSGRPLSQGGRDHASHRLVAVGLSETSAVMVLHALSIASGTIAFVLYQVGFSYAWFGTALVVLALALFGIFLGSVKVYAEDQVPADVQDDRTRAFSLVADFRYKRVVLWVLVDTLTILVAWYTAFLVRYGHTAAWPEELDRFTESAPAAILGVLVGLYARGLYRTDWHHVSLHEIRAIVGGTALGLGGMLLALQLTPYQAGRRPGLAAVAFGVHVLMLAGSRVFVRMLADTLSHRPHGSERVLIYGAGRGGELATRELRSNRDLGKVPVGFIDDNPARQGMTLHGLAVLGGLDSLEAVLRRVQVDAILVSTGKLTDPREAALTELARAHGIRLYRLQMTLMPFEAEPEDRTSRTADRSLEAHPSGVALQRDSVHDSVA